MFTKTNPETRIIDGSRLRLRAFAQAIMLAACIMCGALLNVKAQSAEPTAVSGKYLLFEFFSYESMDSKFVGDQLRKPGPISEIIKEKFQLLSVQRGQAPEKEKQYNVTRYPTLIIAQPDGTEVDRITGLQRHAQIAATLTAVLSGQSEIERAKQEAASPDAGIRQHMALAAVLRQRGDQGGALAEYQWMLDNGQRLDPKRYKSFTYRALLLQLVNLAREYQPAKEELLKRQGILDAAVNAESPSLEAIEQAFIINEATGQSPRNVPLYLKIPDSSPLKQSLFEDVFLALIKASRYKEASAVADLEDFAGSIYPKFRYAPGHHNDDGHDHGQQSLAGRQKIFAWTTAACEGLVALGHMEKAKRVAARGLDYMGNHNQHLLDQLNIMANQLGASADEFRSWLMTYSKTK